MKNITIICLTIITLIFASCTRQVNTETVLNNEETRDQIFTKILDNHEYMTTLMTMMASSNHAKMMMKGNSDMMTMMMENDNMMPMMQENSEMMHNTITSMVKDSNMMKMMVNMMHKEGLMSDDCKESCMMKMNKKDSDGNSDNAANKKDHESHNH